MTAFLAPLMPPFHVLLHNNPNEGTGPAVINLITGCLLIAGIIILVIRRMR
jgi:hypothetical protein